MKFGWLVYVINNLCHCFDVLCQTLTILYIQVHSSAHVAHLLVTVIIVLWMTESLVCV